MGLTEDFRAIIAPAIELITRDKSKKLNLNDLSVLLAKYGI